MGKVLASVGKVSKPGSRWTARRRFLSGDPKAIARHNRRVGEIVYAYNCAQASFFLVFWQIASSSDIELAMDIWDDMPSDSVQRRTLKTYAKRCIEKKAIRNAVLWAITAMDELSRHRNDAVHSNVYADINGIQPDLGTKRSRHSKLLRTPTEQIWRDLKGEFAAIANYVSDLHLDLASSNTWPSTKRPRLKLAQPKLAKE